MSRKRGRVKTRKKFLRKVKFFTLGIAILAILALIVNFPIVNHLKVLRAGVDRFDLNPVAEEVTWIDKEAPWLYKIPMVRDSKLWLELTRGQFESVEDELKGFTDDKHRFWLVQGYLAKNQVEQIQQEIEAFQNSSYATLAQGLLHFKQGKLQEGMESLRSINDSELSREEQGLKYISMGRVEMSQGQLEQAQAYLKRAIELSPQNPLIPQMEFDLAFAQGQWGEAKALVSRLTELPGYEQRLDFLIKKALLALIVGERQTWEQTLDQLNTLENGKAAIDYLLGIEAYERKEFLEAKEYLQRSIQEELLPSVRDDAEKALTQAKERVEAEPGLQKVRKGL